MPNLGQAQTPKKATPKEASAAAGTPAEAELNEGDLAEGTADDAGELNEDDLKALDEPPPEEDIDFAAMAAGLTAIDGQEAEEIMKKIDGLQKQIDEMKENGVKVAATSPARTGPSPVDSSPAAESKPLTEHDPTAEALSDRPPTIRGPSALGGAEMTQELSELKALALSDIVELRADVDKL